MLIIKKYKDYYDGAVGMGIDKTIVYERKLNAMLIPSHIKEKIKEEKNWGTYSFTTQYASFHLPEKKYNTYLIVVGFCGKSSGELQQNPLPHEYNLLMNTAEQQIPGAAHDHANCVSEAIFFNS